MTIMNLNVAMPSQKSLSPRRPYLCGAPTDSQLLFPLFVPIFAMLPLLILHLLSRFVCYFTNPFSPSNARPSRNYYSYYFYYVYYILLFFRLCNIENPSFHVDHMFAPCPSTRNYYSYCSCYYPICTGTTFQILLLRGNIVLHVDRAYHVDCCNLKPETWEQATVGP